jgi:hypothetical protein
MITLAKDQAQSGGPLGANNGEHAFGQGGAGLDRRHGY